MMVALLFSSCVVVDWRPKVRSKRWRSCSGGLVLVFVCLCGVRGWGGWVALWWGRRAAKEKGVRTLYPLMHACAHSLYTAEANLGRRQGRGHVGIGRPGRSDAPQGCVGTCGARGRVVGHAQAHVRVWERGRRRLHVCPLHGMTKRGRDGTAPTERTAGDVAQLGGRADEASATRTPFFCLPLHAPASSPPFPPTPTPLSRHSHKVLAMEGRGEKKKGGLPHVEQPTS